MIWSRCCDADFNSVGARLPCCLSKGSLKRVFLDIYLTAFSEFVPSEIQNLWESSFSSKYLKFIGNFKTPEKNSEKVFFFWCNCIWIGIINLALVRTGYFSSAANVLTSSPKIWHVIKRDVFQLNWLGSDQWIWQSCCDADFNSALTRLPCCFPKGSLKRGFLDIDLTTFSESVISKLQNL